MTRFTRTVARSMLLACVVAVAGCSSYDNPKQAAKSEKPVAAKSAAEKPAAEKAAQTPAVAESPTAVPVANEKKDSEKLPAKAMIAADESDAMQAMRDANMKATERTVPETDPLAASTLSVEPAKLELGTVSTGKFARGKVKITNTGTEPIKLNQCKTSCGCTSTNCPKGQMIDPGQTEEVEIQITAGTRARHIGKTVTFMVEGQRPVTLPVTVEVVAYVTVNPETIDPDVNSDGKIILTATDGQPFRVVSVNPPVFEDTDDVEATEHTLYVQWDKWREQGQNRRLTINVDHPEVEQLSVLVRTRPQTARGPGLVNSPKLQGGVVDQPLMDPTPAQTLAVAVKYGKTDEITKAVKDGLDQPTRDELLNLASRYGQVEVMGVLIESGASLEAKDKLGRTPVLSAVQSRNADAVELLLTHGANVNARDLQEGTPLQRASGSFGTQDMVAELIKAGADVNAADRNGQTALMWAARWGDAQRVQALINAGAKLDLRDSKGLSALDYAMSRRDSDATQKNKVIAIIQPLTHGKADSGGSGQPGVN